MLQAMAALIRDYRQSCPRTVAHTQARNALLRALRSKKVSCGVFLAMEREMHSIEMAIIANAYAR